MTGKLQRSGLLNRRRLAATSTFTLSDDDSKLVSGEQFHLGSEIVFTQALGLAKASKLQGRNTSQVHPLQLIF